MYLVVLVLLQSMRLHVLHVHNLYVESSPYSGFIQIEIVVFGYRLASWKTHVLKLFTTYLEFKKSSGDIELVANLKTSKEEL